MIGAECWIAPEMTAGPAGFLPLSAAAADEEGTRLTFDSNDLLVPETRPPVNVSSKPKGLPRAKTCCPTRRVEAVSLLSIGLSSEKKPPPPKEEPKSSSASGKKGDADYKNAPHKAAAKSSNSLVKAIILLGVVLLGGLAVLFGLSQLTAFLGKL